MIGFKDHMPLLQMENGQVTEIPEDWLRRALLQAADQAGYQNWWLADHILQSLFEYLRLELDAQVLALPRLRTSVESVLQAIGYADVAREFRLPSPPLEISLPDLARAAGSGFELLFFQLLRQRLHAVVEAKTEQIHLQGLAGCVRYLRSAKSWRRECSSLRCEIVEFARSVVTTSDGGRKPVILTLS